MDARRPAYPGAWVGLLSEVSETRREVGRRSLKAFARLYLQRYFSLAPSKLHEELFRLLGDATATRAARLAIAAPRGHAKSTVVSLAYVLWSVCYGTEDYVVIISDTEKQASEHLDAIKAELAGNLVLRQDFPGACEHPGSSPRPPRWRKNEIIARNGVKVVALGAGQKIRGRKHKEHRPSLVIVDDVENEELVGSPERREKLKSWFSRAVLKAGSSRTNFIVIGTVMHYDSLLAELIDPERSPGWAGRKYQAVLSWSDSPELWQEWEAIYCHREEFQGQSGPKAAERFFIEHRDEMLMGAEALWPEREDYYSLMEIRLTEGHASFDSEKQNEPVNPQDCLFQEEDFIYWDDKWASEQELIAAAPSRNIVGSCDPSMGKSSIRGDYSAIITLMRDHKTGILYVLDADIARRKPDEIVDAVIRLHNLRRYTTFAFESNQAQEIMADQLIARSRKLGCCVPVRKVTHTSDKLGRIQSLQPLVKAGTIQFSRRHRTLLEQLRYFPKADHDDGPDALQMAVEVANTGRAKAMILR